MDGPALPRVLLPSWKLGFSLWAGTYTYLCTLKLNVALRWTCPVSSVNNQEELYFSLKGWLVSKPRTFYGQALENFLCWTYVVLVGISGGGGGGILTAHPHVELKFNILKTKNSVLKISAQTPQLFQVFRTSREEHLSFPFWQIKDVAEKHMATAHVLCSMFILVQGCKKVPCMFFSLLIVKWHI